MKKRIIAIIPARSGSKGLPDKNIKLLNKKPLLAYSIQAAKESGLFEIVHVSTDSLQYSQIASKHGADQSFLRDEKNAGDTSSTWDAVREVINKYEAIGQFFDVCVLLQPTSPLRSSKDIKEAYDLFCNMNAKAVVSVTEADHPVQWCFTLDETHSMQSFAKSPYKNARRQDLELHYRENGAIYIVRVEDIKDPEYDIYQNNCYAYVMSKIRSIDIDTITDFEIAEVLIKNHPEEFSIGY